VRGKTPQAANYSRRSAAAFGLINAALEGMPLAQADLLAQQDFAESQQAPSLSVEALGVAISAA